MEEIDQGGTPILNGKNDVHTHRLVVSGLVATIGLSIVGEVVLEALGAKVPSSLGHLAAAALGALAMALSSIMQGNGKKH